MGTTARVQVWAPDSLTCQQSIDSVFAAFHRVDRTMSTYRSDSHLSVLNRDGHRGWVSIGPDLTEVLVQARAFSSLSSGAFDPTVLPLMTLWGFRGGEPRLPDQSEIKSTLESVGLFLLQLDRSSRRARFSRPGVSVDLGGIAKGYALDLGKRAAVAAGARSGLLDLGGNLLVFGKGASGEVGIQDPRSESRIVGRLLLEDQSVSTSGGYERSVTIEGKRYSHILDPRTGRPTDQVASATVVARDGATADALSTACAVSGTRACLEWVEGLQGVEAVMVWYDEGGIRMASSSGLTVMKP